MGIVFRQSAKNAIIIVAGASLGALIMWASAQYIPNKHQLGYVQLLIVYSVTFAQILLAGLVSTMVVYIHRYADNDRKRKLLLTLCFTLPVVFTLLGSLLYILLRVQVIEYFKPEDRPMVARYFYWMPLYTLMFVLQSLAEQYLASQMKVAITAFMREILSRLINITLLFLFAFQFISFDFFIYGMLLTYMIPVAVLLFLSLKTKAFGLSLQLSDFSKTEYIEMGKFSWYHFLLSVSIMFMGYMDQMLLPHLDKSGFAAAAAYRFAAFLVIVLQMPSKALVPASFTVLARAFNDKDMIKAKDFFVRSSINILIPTVGVAVLLLCNLNNVVAIIKNNYSEIIPIFCILFIGAIVNIGTGMNDQVLSIANYYKFNFYLAFFLIAILYILLRVLIPHYGVYGAAWANTITIMLFNISKYLFIRKKVGMQPFTSGTLLVILAALPALAAGYFFPYLFEVGRHVYVHTFLDVIMRSTVIVVVYLGMILWLKPSKDVEEYIASIRKNKRLF